MRLIDADALKKEVESIMSETMDMSFQIYAQGFCTTIDNAPTIDAVPIVRCEECEHSMNKHIGGYKKCALLDAWMQDGSFCSNGERSEE